MSLQQLAYTKQTTKPTLQVVEAVTQALTKQNFGVLCTINASKIIKEKTGKTIEDYFILDICNAKDASYALSLHKEIGLALPCKMVIYHDSGKTIISLFRPTEALKMLGFGDLDALAVEVEGKLKEAVDLALA